MNYIPVIASVISAFSIIIPFACIYYLVFAKRREKLNLDIFVFAIYSILFFLIQSLLLIFAFKGINNHSIVKATLPMEFFFFLFLFLYWFLKNKMIAIAITFVATFISYFIGAIFKEIVILNIGPGIPFDISIMYMGLFEFFVLSALIVNVFIKLYIKDGFGEVAQYRTYLIKGMWLYALGNFIAFALLENMLILSNTIQSILSIISNILFAFAFIKYKSKG